MISSFKVSFFFTSGWLLLLLVMPTAGWSQIDTPEQTRRSLVRIQSVFGACNGVLIRGADPGDRQLMLTARHCFNNNYSNTRFIFGGQPWIEGTDIRTDFWETSSFEVLAESNDLDFVLVDITETIPLYQRPFFAGWETNQVSPLSTYGFTFGDQLLYYEDQDRPGYFTVDAIRDFGGNPVENGAWWVKSWEQGYTTLGSSGSALFDQWSRVIGVLTAGASTPEQPFNDFFSRLDLIYAADVSVAFALSGTSGTGSTNGAEAGSLEKKINYDMTSSVLGTVVDVEIMEDFVFSGSNTIQGIYIPLTETGSNTTTTLRVLQGSQTLHEQEIPAGYLRSRTEHYLPLDVPVNVSGNITIQIVNPGGHTFPRISGTNQVTAGSTMYQEQSIGLGLWVENGAENPAENGELRVYPNPVRNNLFIEGATEDTPLIFTDMSGIRVFPSRTTDYVSRQIINFDQFADGVYLLTLPNGDFIRLFVDN